MPNRSAISVSVKGPAAIALRILDLTTNFTEGLSFPRHFPWCKMPLRVPRHAAGLEVRRLVTAGTAHGLEAMAIRAALDRRLVQTALIALTRAIALGVAVDASRIREHLAEFGKQGDRALFYVTDRRKTVWCGQGVRGGISGKSTYHNAHQRHDGSENFRPQFGFHL